jgi:hypothetical protein
MRVLTIAFLLLLLTAQASALDRVTGIARFRETQSSYRQVGQGAGRSEVWRTRVYTYEGKFVGTGVMSCVYIDTHTSSRQCLGTYLLPLGKISVAGAIVNRSAFELVVFQGTRYYADARGTSIIRRYSRRPPQSFVTFYLVR